MGKPATRPPRRLSSDDRRRQLTDIAYSMVAHEGSDSISLDEIAERADVTRNLLYHYFPRGRRDILLAAARRCGDDLTRGFTTDPELSLEERLARNFAIFFDHAERRSDAWRVLLLTRNSADPEVRAIGDDYRERIVTGVASNHFGTEQPPELARVALRSFMAFSETALDEWSRTDVPREQILAMLGRTLVALVAATKDIEQGAEA